MFIEFEDTPNPNTLKFLPGRAVLAEGMRQFTLDGQELRPPRLAESLLKLPGVESVFLGPDFISVTKADEFIWDELKPDILTAIMEHFTAGGPVFTEEELARLLSGKPNAATDDASEIERQIREILDTRVKPAVAMDGGNIEFDEFRDGVVYLRMEGACAGCPSSTMTLKHGIENMLKHFVPEVERVEAVDPY